MTACPNPVTCPFTDDNEPHSINDHPSVNIKMMTVGGEQAPEYIDITLGSGQVVRYRREGQ